MMILEDLKPYRLACCLRAAAKRNPNESRLLNDAAEWLEGEAKDILALNGSVTHNAITGKITPGCVI